MPRYKIIYDRKNCIGVSSCALLAEKFWVMNRRDDKAVLVGWKRVGEKLVGAELVEGELVVGKLGGGKLVEGTNQGHDTWELIIDEKDLEVNKDAARNCPVNVIKIYEEEGKEVTL